jgi:prepilin-type N-terminal cleavage/methylation domain-containing protein
MRRSFVMLRREHGFTLIEILVVITIIAALVGMVTLVIPKGQEAKNRVTCMNNLRQIGALLVALDAGPGVKEYNGAAFVLQVAGEVKNEDLDVFVCPGEPDNMDDPRAAANTPDFIAMYRDQMDLKSGKVEERFTSYAGPNFRKYPVAKAGPAANETRLWACDKCRNGAAYHDGIVVLYTSSKVDFLKLEDLEGHNVADGTIRVGPDSGDPRLSKMCFFPNQ